MRFKTQRKIEWGDCDSAGIVYYPNYFRWMDQAFHELALAEGFNQRRLLDEYGLLGTPLVGAGGDFTSPASYGDIMDIYAWFTHLGRSSMRLGYRLEVDGRVIVEGHEKRVFGKGGAAGLQTVEIPPDLRPGIEQYLEPQTAAK